VTDIGTVSGGIIQVMPETLANKIAAGEVVQRPASVAKELLENAIDAAARNVDLIVKSAGSELIQVMDDGCGMTPEDALTCFKRHATSKIRQIDDLERIATLGFRGEALASIASVSQVELRTKQPDAESGTRVRIDGGTLTDHEPCAATNGTSIAVRNLFYNVPARRNFLKTPSTELRHLLETFNVLALANPAVGFRFIQDEEVIHHLPPLKNMERAMAEKRRVADLLGDPYADRSYRLDEATSYLSLRGLIGHADFHRKSRGDQYLFVNGRNVKSRYLEHAVAGAYEGLLPDGAFPFFVLFLDLDPRHIDVNVHPTKAEIKFDDERGVYAFVRSVVRRSLGAAHLTPDVQAAGGSPFSIPVSFTASGVEGRAGDGADRPTTQPSSASFGGHGLSAGDLSERFYGPLPGEASAARLGLDSSDDAAPDPVDQYMLWQLHERYILTPIRSGLMILDQNAAHERILYEQALQSMGSGFGLAQQLLFPHTMEWSATDFEILKSLLLDLRALGFDIEMFSGRSVVIRGVPAEIRAGDERTILRDIVDQYKEFRERLQLKGRENLAKSLARRSAIRSGTRLSAKEMRALIDQLFDCEMPYACPLGRPTLIKIPIEELDKRFGR
jgi:DNA mismatch repair protein MutL